MIKKFFISMMLCASSMLVSAQVKTIFCETFSHSYEASAADAEQLRNEVMNEIAAAKRVNIQDAKTSHLRAPNGSSMNDVLARREMVKLAGADFILEGNLVKSHTDTHVTKGEKEDTYSYEHTLTYTLNLINIATDMQDLQTYTVSYKSYSSPEEAKKKTFEKVSGDIRGFINAYFPLASTILGERYTTNKAKDKLETCYISLGQADGVKPGDYFEVFQVSIVNGSTFENKVGALEVTAVGGDHLAKCKVTKEAEKVMAALNEYINDKEIDPQHAEPLRVKTANKGNSNWQKVSTVGTSVAAAAIVAYLLFVEGLEGDGEGGTE